MGFSKGVSGFPIVSIVVLFLVDQNLYYTILTINWLTSKGTTMETMGSSEGIQGFRGLGFSCFRGCRLIDAPSSSGCSWRPKLTASARWLV